MKVKNLKKGDAVLLTLPHSGNRYRATVIGWWPDLYLQVPAFAGQDGPDDKGVVCVPARKAKQMVVPATGHE